MIECMKYREVNRGCLLGFADIYVTNWKFEILGVAIYEKANQKWISLPNKEFIGENNTKAYAPIVRFREKSHYDEFSRQVKQAVEQWCKENDTSK